MYYRSRNGLYSARIAPGPVFLVIERTMLFESPELRSAQIERDYDGRAATSPTRDYMAWAGERYPDGIVHRSPVFDNGERSRSPCS